MEFKEKMQQIKERIYKKEKVFMKKHNNAIGFNGGF